MYKLLFTLFLLSLNTVPIIADDINPPENISSSLNREYDPSFSPNGRYITYCVEAGGDENIWLLDLRDQKKKQITFHSASDYSPCFLGNSKILFVSRRGNSLGEIYITDINGKNQKLLIGGGRYYDTPAVSNNMNLIAYIQSELNDSVFIYIYDAKKAERRKGPAGIDPSFFPSGDSIIFVSIGEVGDFNRLAVFSLVDSSVEFLNTGSGLHLNPVVMYDGNRVLFEKKSRDTNEDGRITVNDESDLLILNLNDGDMVRLLPGYEFTNHRVSRDNRICAQSNDDKIFLIEPDGITGKESGGESQYALSDSIVDHSLTYNDSLVGAVACYEAFYYYPEYCQDLLMRAALIYANQEKYGLALDILKDRDLSSNKDMMPKIKLTEAKIRYKKSEQNEYIKEKIKALDIIEDLLKDDSLSINLAKNVYRFGIELYFNEKMYDSGKELIDVGMGKFKADKDFMALLETWELRYLANTYAGDIQDLIPLYIELIEKYRLYGEINSMLIGDLKELLTGTQSGNVLDELEQLRSDYEWFPALTGMASLEQARILSQQGRKSLAEWRLNEIIDNYRDNPDLRFSAFNELLDLFIEQKLYGKAEIIIDSAFAYLEIVEDYGEAQSFRSKAAEFYAFLGYEKLSIYGIEDAQKLFVKALTCDAKNYNAIWGLAKTGYIPDKKDRSERAISYAVTGAARDYLNALAYIVKYENDKNISDLQKARNLLVNIMDKYPEYSLSYLTAGYADCRLEEQSKEQLGLFEEAVEFSLKGISLIGKNKSLVYGFYLNLAEAYFGLEQFNDAFIYYTKARDINPSLEDDTRFIKKYGESAFYIDSLDTAKINFEKLSKRSADSGDLETRSFALLKLGLLNQLEGDYIEAAEMYEEAKGYYRARNDRKTVLDILKAQAFCLKMSGDDNSASEYSGEALNLHDKAKYKYPVYDNRVKFILWPFGISIPLIELLPMRFGGSLYPEGFTRAAEKSFLLELLEKDQDIASEIALSNRQIEILKSSNEEENSIDLWDKAGGKYLEIGYSDSSIISYKRAYKLCMDLEDYNGAYIELLNWAEAVFSGFPKQDDENILKQLSEISDKSSDLYDFVLPSYPNARANLKNITGLTEYLRGIIEAGNIQAGVNGDFASFLSAVGDRAREINDRFSKSVYYFREALGELVPGDYPDIETALSLNIATASYALGDFENLRLAIKDAKKSAVFTSSARLYAKLAGIDAILNEGEGKEYINSLLDAVKLYENMPTGRYRFIDTPLLKALYMRIIDYYLKAGDGFSALLYLESINKLLIVTEFNRIRTALYKSDQFRASMDLMRTYQKDLIDQYMEKKRLEAMGALGRIRLGEVTDEILKFRGRLLELRGELEELDPAVYSVLVYDPGSVKAVLEDIPGNEFYIVARGTTTETAIWICRTDSLFYFTTKDLGSLNLPEILGDSAVYNMATIISSESDYKTLRYIIKMKYPGIAVKRAYLLEDTQRTQIEKLKNISGAIILRFEGNILTDRFASEIGADVINFDSTCFDEDLKGYGWIILDGEFLRNKNNFLLSGWNIYSEGENTVNKAKLQLKDLIRLKNDVFGLVIIDSSIKGRTENPGMLVNTVKNMGVNTLLIINNIKDTAKLENNLKEYFDGIDAHSPLESYSEFMDTELNNRGDSISYGISYYGDSGWSRAEEDEHIKNVFNDYILIGNQYYIQKNWRMAERYYALALNTVKNKDFDISKEAYLARKLMDTFKKMDEYDKKIERNINEFISIFNKSGDSSSAAKIYADMAEISYGKSRFRESVAYASSLLNLVEAKKDTADIAKALALRGKALIITGQLNRAEEDLLKSLELIPDGNIEEKILTGLYLAELYNLKGMNDNSKMTLDSMKVLFEGIDNAEMQRKYSIQLSRYFIGIFRNREAGRILESLMEENKNDPEVIFLSAKINFMRGEFDSAMELLRKSLSLLIIGGKPLLVMESYELLGDIYRISGEDENAMINYRLAEAAINDYEYKKNTEILKYKIALCQEDASDKQDSLFKELIYDSQSEFTVNLCRYQLGHKAAIEKKGKEADRYFLGIFESEDENTMRYLGWRAYFNLALIAEEENIIKLLRSAEEKSVYFGIEPDYVNITYGLKEEKADLYNMLADIMIDEDSMLVALNYLEAGYSQKISGRYYSIGAIDSGDSLPDHYVNEFADDVLRGDNRTTADDLLTNLAPGELVLRFYRYNGGFTAACASRDTVFIHRYDFNEDTLSESLSMMNDLLANQQKADSVTEKWYVELISPIEGFLEDKDKILIVPDGILHFFPFEVLKMPDGDYLSEMYTVKRHAYLPQEFPKEPAGEVVSAAEYNTGNDMDIQLIQYIVRPLLEPARVVEGRVKFNSGDFSEMYNSFAGNNDIVCMVKPFKDYGYLNLAIQAIVAARNGYSGFIYPLWGISNDIQAAFYWKFAKSLTDGTGYWNAYRRSRSYIFGHYDGIPNFWGANVYMSLN